MLTYEELLKRKKPLKRWSDIDKQRWTIIHGTMDPRLKNEARRRRHVLTPEEMKKGMETLSHYTWIAPVLELSKEEIEHEFEQKIYEEFIDKGIRSFEDQQEYIEFLCEQDEIIQIPDEPDQIIIVKRYYPKIQIFERIWLYKKLGIPKLRIIKIHMKDYG